MEIDLGYFRLREWRRGDEASLVRHANNPKIANNLRDRFPQPYTLEDAHWWISRCSAERPTANFAIVVDGEAAGAIGFLQQEDIARRSIEIGYWLGEAYWGRGIVTDAVRAVTAYGFANFDICRIFATVFGSNPASARVLEKAGYACEGRLRKAATKNGQTLDLLMYALVKDE